jgi:hypothetical protein
MFTDYTLTLHIDRLVGGIPRHPEIVKRWQEARWPKGAVATDLADAGITPETAAAQTVDELGDNAMSEEEVAAVWTSFATVGEGDASRPVIESRQIKAMLKESANIIKNMPEVRVAGKAIPLRAKLAERVFPAPKWMPILNDSNPDKPVEVLSLERPIHVMTAQGPRTALKRTDYVDDARLVVTLRVLDDGVITEKVLRSILDHASLNGVGTDRSQGAGTFEYDLEKRGE